MKKPTFPLMMLFCIILSYHAHGQNPALNGIPFDIYLFDKDKGIFKGGYPGAPLTVKILLKYNNGDIIYEENHVTELDGSSHVIVPIGKGDAVFGHINLDSMQYVDKICYTVTFDNFGELVTIMGEQKYGEVGKAMSAYNSIAFGGNEWNPTPVSLDNIFQAIESGEGSLVGQYNFNQESYLGRIPLNELVTKQQAPSAVDGTPVDYYLSNKLLSRPCASGGDALAEVENYKTMCLPSLEHYYNGLGVKILDGAGGDLAHNTSAIFGQNIYDPRGVGVYGSGASRGLAGQGQTGGIGVTTGQGNGSGLWGVVSQAPANGGFKYGILGDNQSLAYSYSAAFFGDGFHTGAWMDLSDASLKTNIQTYHNATDQVKKLRPTHYNFVDDTPYHLPKGMHYGFIAQELEEVLPDLVKDIVLPKSLDPDEMANSGTVTYKAINYIEIIPILTAALQELNDVVESQAKEIELLKKELQTMKHK